MELTPSLNIAINNDNAFDLHCFGVCKNKIFSDQIPPYLPAGVDTLYSCAANTSNSAIWLMWKPLGNKVGRALLFPFAFGILAVEMFQNFATAPSNHQSRRCRIDIRNFGTDGVVHDKAVRRPMDARVAVHHTSLF